MMSTEVSPIARLLHEVYASLAAQPIEGEVADYIPELFKADPSWFGAVLTTADGHTYCAGDVDVPFTIQSISKPFVYGMVLEACGVNETLAKVGVEPSGEAFNSISLYPDSGRPLNPMINAGAIACAGLLHALYGDRTIERMVHGFGKLAGRPLRLDDAVYESERSTGHRNRAISHLLRNFDILSAEDVNQPLHAYFAQCSVQVTCRDLSMMGATLASHGVNPSTGQRALAPEHVHRVLSVMNSCGMYDYSGEWGFRVGLPAKSGVSGGILAVLPGQLALAVFSPPLDARGNSVRGIRMCEALGRRLQLHMLNTPIVGSGAIRRDRTGADVRSRRARRPERERLLEQHGHRIRIMEVQGELSFTAAEVVTRRLVEGFDQTRYAVLDLHRVSSIDATAIELLLSLLDGFESAGKTLVFARCQHLKSLIVAMLSRRDSERLSIADDPAEALEQCEEDLLAELQSPQTIGVEGTLAEQPLMRGLTEPEVLTMRSRVTRRAYAAGTLIIREGDPASHLYFVSQGHASVLFGNPSKPTAIVAHVQAGMCVGEMAMIDRRPRSASVRADLPTVCLELPFSALDEPDMREIRHKLLANLAADLSERLRKANEEIRALS